MHGLVSTRNQAKADVFDYIECFYNPQRRALDDRVSSPVEFGAAPN
jgi:hypothetical protein